MLKYIKAPSEDFLPIKVSQTFFLSLLKGLFPLSYSKNLTNS